MSSPGPTRTQGDLAEMLETLLDKGVLINADIAVTVGDTELLGIRVQAAIASFATAAEYGMEFPTGTNMDRVQQAADLDAMESSAGSPRRFSETGPENEDRRTPESTGEPGREVRESPNSDDPESDRAERAPTGTPDNGVN